MVKRPGFLCWLRDLGLEVFRDLGFRVLELLGFGFTFGL